MAEEGLRAFQRKVQLLQRPEERGLSPWGSDGELCGCIPESYPCLLGPDSGDCTVPGMAIFSMIKMLLA